MRFGLLGTVVVRSGDELTGIRWPMSRAVLALLLLNANRVVPAERLIDALWGDNPPPSAQASLHNHVMRLRTALAQAGAGQLKTVDPGYLIEVPDGDLDLDEFIRGSERGMTALAAADFQAAADELSAALDLWRGEPLADVTTLLRDREAPRLEQLRIIALEARIDADLRLGRAPALIAELCRLVAEHPLREQLHGQLMKACYQAGRRGEALAAYQRARDVLATELGIEPGAELRRLQQQILTENPALAAPDRPAPVIRPAQLPADLADFTGRNDQVEALTGVLNSAGHQPGVVPVAVITGPGGVGKTTLALHVAHEVRNLFPDGQLVVRLGGASPSPAQPAAVLSRFLRDLGADPARISGGEAERAAQYRSILAGRRVLVLLDDARDSPQVQSLLPGTSGCAVILTSRGPLADLPGGRQVPLAAYPGDQALDLLSAIIGADRVAAEPQAAGSVATLCAGLPLALRIAGSRLATRPHWRIADLAGRLTDTTGRLDELTVGELSVRASFDVSYANLPTPAAGIMPARAFRLLALWTGPDTSTPAAAALLGVSVPAAGRVLETLLDSHLLEAGSRAGRYRFHDLLGVYAAERARAEESAASMDAALAGLLSWYLRAAVTADQVMAPGTRPVPLDQPVAPSWPGAPASPDDAVAWMKDELPNLHAAVRMAAARGDHRTAWKMAAALCTFHMRQSLWQDWICTENLGLASARAIGDHLGEAWLLNGLAVAHWQIGESAEAMDMLAEALRIRRDIDDRGGVVASLANLGFLMHELGRLPEAVTALEEALDVNQTCAQPDAVLAEILIGLGQTLHALGDHDRARASLEEALQVGRRFANGEWEGAALKNLAAIAASTAGLADSARLYDEAIAVFNRAGDRYQETTALIDSGHAYALRAEPDEARRRWQRARAIAEETFDPRVTVIEALLAESRRQVSRLRPHAG